MKIYLCGPINGCTDDEAINWRDVAKAIWGEANCIDPMRRDYRGKEIGHVSEIVELDKLDIRESDILLANCWQPSVSTSMEIMYAYTIGVPVIAIVPEGARVSPWLNYHALYIVHSLVDAANFIYDEWGKP